MSETLRPSPEADTSSTSKWDTLAAEVPMATAEQPAGEEQPASPETVEKDIYSAEYREQVNVPQYDLFCKRMRIISDQYPILRQQFSQKEYQNLSAEDKQAYDAVPATVREEHRISHYMLGYLTRGIHADSTPDQVQLADWQQRDRLAQALPQEVTIDGGISVIAAGRDANEVASQLERLKELHERNSEIIDFSHEDDVDVSKIPDDLQQKIDSISASIENLKNTASIEDFEPHGDERAKTAEIGDSIFGLFGYGFNSGFAGDQSDPSYLGYVASGQARRAQQELRTQFLEARDAAELRHIDAEISKLQQEKAEVEARKQKYQNSNFVMKFFRRLVNPGEEDRLSQSSDSINSRLKSLGSRRERRTQ